MQKSITQNNKKFYITTPIYYVNDVPHIGHAYTTLACDFIARFKRLDNYDVHFLTGTDEHGQKIEKAALAKGIDPKTFTDNVSIRFRDLCEKMNFSNDDFIRSSEKRHTDYVKGVWKKLIDNGHIYLGKYSGWYSTRDEAFYAESELIGGLAPTGAAVEWVEEESYFFRLSEWQDKLLEFYDKNPDFIAPNSRRNEVISFVKSGLMDLSVSRTSFSWGIPVPGDEKHVIYVWLDALFNYISAIADGKMEYWPCDVHMAGKDILRFHAVYWPAFLMAAGIECPKRVFAHGWWTNNGEKISKSLGNIIDPNSLVEQYSLDYVRYFLMKEMLFGNDGNYFSNTFKMRVNSELVNNIGNLAHRVMTFIYNKCDGIIPNADTLNTEDIALLEEAHATVSKMRLHIDKQEISLALTVIIDLAHSCNLYMDKNAPWKLLNTDKNRMGTVLAVLSECIRVIAITLQPIVPDSAAKMLSVFGFSEIQNFDVIGDSPNCLSRLLEKRINEPSVIFERIL